MNYTIQKYLALAALLLTVLFFVVGCTTTGLFLITLAGVILNRPQAHLCAVTLSVPEILKDIFEAFRSELFEVFGSNGFTKDFKSDTAKLGDKITAKLSHLPVTGTYDQNTGFENASQDVLTLIEDVNVTLNQMPICSVKIGFLTALATKDVPLYQAAIQNSAFALVKYVIDNILISAVNNVSHVLQMLPSVVSLDSFDGPLRAACNAQKMSGASRFAIINTPLASALGSDDRTRSSLFVNQRNGEQGIRTFKNVAGFNLISEYPDFALGNIGGLAGDSRLVCMSVRKIPDANALFNALRIPKTMDFYPFKDEKSGLEMCGVSYQKQGTGDVYASMAILFGLGVGNQGGAPGTMTDNSGLLIRIN